MSTGTPAAAISARQLAARPGAGGGIEGRQRLVQQQHLGLARQRPGQGHALALATGQGGRDGRRHARPGRSGPAARARARAAARASRRRSRRPRCATRSGARTARSPGTGTPRAAARAAGRRPPRCPARCGRRSAPARGPGAAGRPPTRSSELLPAPEGPASARHSPAATARLGRPARRRPAAWRRQARASPSTRAPPAGLTARRIAPLAATSTADSASAPVKSSEKRS